MNNAHIVIDHKGEKTYAHRLSYQLNVEDIPDHPLMLTEGLVLHHCNNKWCIEPTHLYIGNATDRPQPIRRKYRTKKEMEELRHKKRLRLEDLKMRRGKRAR